MRRRNIQWLLIFLFAIGYMLFAARFASASYNPNWTSLSDNETITGNWTFSGDTTFSGEADFATVTVTNDLTVSGSIYGTLGAGTIDTAADYSWTGAHGFASVTVSNAVTVDGVIVSSDECVGLDCSSKGRIEFEDEATDNINLMDAYVGIGTTAPGGALHVNGTTILQGTRPQLRFINDEGRTYRFQNGLSGDNNIFAIYDETASATRVVLNENGNIGIGTTNPTIPLYVVSAEDTVVRFESTDANTYVSIKDNGGTVSLSTNSGAFIFDTPDDKDFIWRDNFAERMRLDTSVPGLGIGTNAPKNMLDVEGSVVIGATYSGTSAGPTNGLAVQGNVGIGLTAPTAKLHVVASADPAFLVVDHEGEEVMKVTGSINSANLLIEMGDLNETMAGPYYVIDQDGDAHYLMGGNVGIGDATPTESELVVEGQIYQTTFTAPGSDTMCWDGSGGSKIGDCSSLLAHKTNIEDIGFGLTELLQLKPREFDWIPEKGGRHDFGFIAEEVADVNPLFATSTPEGKLRGVKYRHLVALLTKAIQEQQTQIESQKTQIESLEQRIQALEAK